MSVYLKIKQKHLALEPNIIRREEQKVLRQIEYLRDHGGEEKIINNLQMRYYYNIL